MIEITICLRPIRFVFDNKLTRCLRMILDQNSIRLRLHSGSILSICIVYMIPTKNSFVNESFHNDFIREAALNGNFCFGTKTG